MLISFNFSIALSRPNLLRYSGYMTECCQRLERDQKFYSDDTILHMFSLHSIGDDVHTALRSEDGDECRVNQVRVQVMLDLLSRMQRGCKPSKSYVILRVKVS